VPSYDGDMESYRAELLADRESKRARGPEARDSAQDTTSRADVRRAAADRRAQLAPLRKAMADAEKLVDNLSAKIAACDAVLADLEIYTRDPQKAQRTGLERGQLAKQLADAEESWLIASEAYDAADTMGTT